MGGFEELVGGRPGGLMMLWDELKNFLVVFIR